MPRESPRNPLLAVLAFASIAATLAASSPPVPALPVSSPPPTAAEPAAPDAIAVLPSTTEPPAIGERQGEPPPATTFATVSPGALASFGAAFCAATPARPLVVVQLGDSHTAGGFMTTALAAALSPGQTTTPGYLAPRSTLSPWVTSTLSGRWLQGSWLRDHDGLSAAQSGPGGQVAVAPSKGPATVELRFRPAPPPTTPSIPPPATPSAETAILPSPPTTSLPFGARVTLLHDPATPVPDDGLRIDGVAAVPIERTQTEFLARTTLALPPGTSRVTLDARGTGLRFYGWVVGEPRAPVEVDAIGVVGVTVMQTEQRADRSLEDYLAWRRPDAVIVWLGTNDAVAPSDEYRKFDGAYGRWLDRLRAAAPQASLVGVGPPDLDRRPAGCAAPVSRGRHRRGRLTREQLVDVVCRPEALPLGAKKTPPVPLPGVRTAADWARWVEACGNETVATLPPVIAAERAAIEKRGGVFFDTFSWMGGARSIRRFACLEPPLASLDLVHLKPEGYALLGAATADVLKSGARCAPSNATVTPSPSPSPTP